MRRVGALVLAMSFWVCARGVAQQPDSSWAGVERVLGREPRLYFMHFWANADAIELARGLRAALDQTASQSP